MGKRTPSHESQSPKIFIISKLVQHKLTLEILWKSINNFLSYLMEKTNKWWKKNKQNDSIIILLYQDNNYLNAAHEQMRKTDLIKQLNTEYDREL